MCGKGVYIIHIMFIVYSCVERGGNIYYVICMYRVYWCVHGKGKVYICILHFIPKCGSEDYE